MQRPYWNPYLAGVGLGLTLLFSYVVLGTGLGASGGITRVAATTAHAVAPAAVEGNRWLAGLFADGSPLAHYLVAMLLGTFAGGLLSARAAGRFGVAIERGASASAASPASSGAASSGGSAASSACSSAWAARGTTGAPVEPGWSRSWTSS